jgi:hypothetical protein
MRARQGACVRAPVVGEGTVGSEIKAGPRFVCVCVRESGPLRMRAGAKKKCERPALGALLFSRLFSLLFSLLILPFVRTHHHPHKTNTSAPPSSTARTATATTTLSRTPQH